MGELAEIDPEYRPAHGTLEEGLALIGVPSPVISGMHPVNAVRIAQFCTMIEDGNPAYWDEAASADEWGRPIAPPAMLQSWAMPLPWHPDGTSTLDFMMMKLPLPGASMINVSTDVEFYRPLHIGETVSVRDRAIDVSEKKHTRLGIGHFVTTVADYRDQYGNDIATVTNVHFRFDPVIEA